MRPLALILISLALLSLLPLTKVGAQQWDLALERVSIAPIDGKVQQGQTLLISAQIKNLGNEPFKGEVRLEVYVDDKPVIVEIWILGDKSPIPVGGIAAITRRINTTELSIGLHSLKVEVLPHMFSDPDLKNNIYTLQFVVLERAKAYIEAEEFLQGVESQVEVYVDNPTKDRLDLKVKLLANGTEVGMERLTALPSTVSVAYFSYIPEEPGVIVLRALIMRGSAVFAEATYKAMIKATCDVGIEDVRVPEVLNMGQEVNATIYIYSNGPTHPKSVLTIILDNETVHEEEIQEYRKVEVPLPTATLSIGEHTLKVALKPLEVVDINKDNNYQSVEFEVRPVPIMLYVSPVAGGVEVNLTNVGEVMANFRVSLISNGTEVDSLQVTLSPGESRLLSFRVGPGSYLVQVYQDVYKIGGANITVSGGASSEGGGLDFLPVVLAVLVIIAVGLAYRKLRHRKWPAK